GVARPARFAGQKHHVFFHGGFDRGTVRRGGCRQRFRFHVLESLFVCQVGALGCRQFDVLFLVRRFVLFVVVFLMSGFGREVFLVFFLLGLFVLVVLLFGLVMMAVLFALSNLMRLVKRFGLVIELGAAHQGVGFGTGLRLFVFGFHQARGKGSGLLIAEGCAVQRLGVRFFRFVRCLGGFLAV